MKAAAKCRKLVFTFFPCLVLLGFGAYLAVMQPQEKMIRDMIAKQAELVEGNPLYDKVWVNLDLHFRAYLFDVQNPDEIMEGATPQFKERGPYVYNMNVRKNVLSVDEDADEITFTTIRTYQFNKDLSGGTENDDIILLNSGYVGIIMTMANQFPAFIKKMGNDIEKLFPDMDDLFIRAKAGNILFTGLPMVCDPAQFPELKLICGFLSGKKPPGIKNTEVPGVYEYSFFQMLNGTEQGPMVVNRGVKNKTRLGDTTSFKGKRKQRMWASDECNKIVGTDSITWAPMEEDLDYVVSFEPQICRWTNVYFKKEVVVSGLVGRHFQGAASNWQPDGIKCYCPVVKKQPVCLPTGIMDINKCTEAPIFYSEPHFLFGDPSLREYAKGLTPEEDKHASFIIIEPVSGAPLAGSKKMQLNAKIMPNPGVTMMVNVSTGYFPILWVEETAHSDVATVADILQAFRLLRLARYISHLPLVLGIFFTLKAIFLFDDPPQTFVNTRVFLPSQSVLIRNSTVNSSPRITRRNRPRDEERRSTE